MVRLAPDEVRSLEQEISQIPDSQAPTLKRVARKILGSGDVVIVVKQSSRLGPRTIRAVSPKLHPPEAQWLTPKQVAEMFLVSERTVRKWCEKGLIKAVQPGGPRGDWRIARSQFAAGPDEVRTLLETVGKINERFEGEVDDYE